MRIFHVAETIKGGVGTVIDSLIANQQDNPLVENVKCLIPEQHRNNLCRVESHNIFTFNRKKRGLKSLMLFLLKFLDIVRKENFDVIHLHSSFAGVICRVLIFFSGRKKNIKLVYSPHAFSFLMDCGVLKRKIYTGIEVLLSKISDKIICVSNQEYDAALSVGIPRTKLVIVHNGVNIKHDIVFKDINNKNTTFNILFVGRFDFQKGMDILQETISFLSVEKHSNKFLFELVGDFVNNKNDLQSLSGEYKRDNVKLCGWLSPDELSDKYLHADCIVIPSRWEGFAMVPLEAMSYGVPIIASDINAFKEIIEHESTGILFESGDYHSLNNALLSLEFLDLNSIRNNAYKLFVENYTADKMTKKTFDIYTSLH